jgi:hypothetical protein
VLWVDGVKDQYQFGMDTWNAISTIDWFAVSEVLKEHGFVDRVFTEFDESEYVSQVKQDLKQYIAQVSRNPRFINFMMELKEAALNNEHNAIINNGFNETQ